MNIKILPPMAFLAALNRLGKDGLTGIWDHASFAAFGDKLLGDKRRKEPCLLLLADINDFKRVNDTFGHPEGDRLLIKVAQFFQAAAGRGIAGRLGGDEFALLLPGCDMAAGKQIQYALEGGLKNMGISSAFGRAAAGAEEKISFACLYAKADAMLYQRKKK